MDAAEYLQREIARVGATVAAIGEERSRGVAPGPWVSTIRAARAARAHAASDRAPFERAARVFELDEPERDLLALCIGVESSSELAAQVARLAGTPWPTLGLTASIARLAGESFSPLQRLERPAFRDGLFEMLGDGPLATRGIRVIPWLAPVLAGAQRNDAVVRDSTTLDQMIGPAALREAVVRWAASPTHPLVLAGNVGSGRRLWAAAALGATGTRLVAISAEPGPIGAARLARSHARWHASAVLIRFAPGVFSGAEGPALARRLLDDLSAPGGPIVLGVSAADAAVLVASEPALVRGDVGALTTTQRAQLWQRLLPEEIASGVAQDLAATFAFRSEQVRHAVAMAGGRRTSEVRKACRALGATMFGELAEPLPRTFRRTDLIVPDRVGHEIDLAIGWIRHRRMLLDDWGFSDRMPYGRGVAVLFAGRPGTGKTMAAQVLASELDMDLYRVNLARIVSKYVGETEKHLARLFDEARSSGAILFFDEADALFGKRGQVRDATDRWANLEIGYLLQRMEQHEGVSVLATNRHGDLDEAFMRRFQVSIVFPMPELPERIRLWQRMLPERAPRDPDLPLDQLATYALSGGDIQTAATTAAVLAAEARTPIGANHLYRGIHRVLVKSGIMPDERLTRLVRATS